VSSKDLTTTPEGITPSKLPAFLIPSLSDWVFITLLGWLFFFAAGAASLLGDGDTGWHIRAGDYILASNFRARTCCRARGKAGSWSLGSGWRT